MQQILKKKTFIGIDNFIDNYSTNLYGGSEIAQRVQLTAKGSLIGGWLVHVNTTHAWVYKNLISP